MPKMNRRKFFKSAGATLATASFAGAVGFPQLAIAKTKKVVVVGGGSGGAIAARYIKAMDRNIDVTLIEQNKHYYTCFMSNEVLGGERRLSSLKFDYSGLKRDGIHVVHDYVNGVSPKTKTVSTKGGNRFSYDRLVLSPGIDFAWGAIEGYDEAAAQVMPHAYKAGPQTELLVKKLEGMPKGGTVIIVAPENPFRCPPGPYERACQIAHFLKTRKPGSKLLVLDAKDKFSKQGLFQQAWKKLYPDIIEWVPGSETGGGVKAVDVKKMIVSTDFESYKGDVINVIPPQKAGHIAHVGGLSDKTGWCPVHLDTFESTIHPNIHVVGDSSVATGLPKSGYAANSEAKVCAAAVVALLNGRSPGVASYVNTCYSIAAPGYGFSVAAVYRLGEKGKKIEKLSGGLTPKDASPEILKREAEYAHSWFRNITIDMFS